MWAAVPTSAAPLPIQLPTSGLEKEGGTKPWDPTTMWKTQKALGFGSAQLWLLQPLE